MEKPTQEQEQVNLQENGSQDNHEQGAPLQSEADLKDLHDQHHEEEEEDYKNEDYSRLSKKELANLIKELSRDENFKKVDYVLKEIKPVFEDIFNKQRQEALDKFVQTGGDPVDFDYKGDTLDMEFDAHAKLIKDRKSQHIKNQEDKKTDNLTKKESILEKLRELVDSVDAEHQFDTFKELQREWKSIGAVPAAYAKTLWANYHALVDRFYDNQSIYFELKELDRRKNLEAKIELCERAEKLAEVEIIKDAVKELNELHHEFKHIGPVPQEDKEAVWQRFKTASDAVYQRRDSFMQNLQQELGVNLDKKLALCDELEQFISFQSDRIKEWNQKTKEILEIQKKWEIVGGLPRAKAKEVNKKFWNAFKTFFNNKNTFFKKLDEEREHNLQQKKELVARAHQLKESNDWDQTSQELKNIQSKWKEIGPVPEKFRDKIFQEFKEACDHFFNQRRNQQGKNDQEQLRNLEAKKAICETLKNHVAEGTASVALLKELQSQYDQIGFVPKRELNTIRDLYNDSVNAFVDAIQGVTEDDKSRILLENQINGLKDDPNADRKIFHKEQAIRKKISKVENDIALWKNNLEFFANSRNADKVKEEFNDKIDTASDHLKQLKEQLKLLRTVS